MYDMWLLALLTRCSFTTDFKGEFHSGFRKANPLLFPGPKDRVTYR